MNKIYKVVWSKVRNCYVVVSELAKKSTKSCKSVKFSHSLVAGVLACVLSCGIVSFAEATDFDHGNYRVYPIYDISTSDESGNVTYYYGLAVDKTTGKVYTAEYADWWDSLSITSGSMGTLGGSTSYSAGNGLVLGGTTFSVKAGTGITVNSNGVSITSGSVASGNVNAITGGTAYSELRPANGTFVKSNQTTATNLTALDTASKNAIKGLSTNGSVLTYTKGDGTTGTLSTYAQYLGIHSSGGSNQTGEGASGEDAIAIGKNAKATKKGSIAIGLDSYADEENVISLGHNKSEFDEELNQYVDSVTDNPVGSTALFTTDLNRRITNVADGIYANDAATYGQLLSIQGGVVAQNNSKLISGGTAFTELRPADGQFIRRTNTTAQNLTALDTMGKNAIKSMTVDGNMLVYTRGDNISISLDLPTTGSGTSPISRFTGEGITTTVGSVTAFASNSTPTGYLLCDGRAVSRTKYANLFRKIGTTYGAGDGSTTFNLPNLVNRFVEGSNASGQYINAGLPNITGAHGAWNYNVTEGAFYGRSDLSENIKSGGWSSSGVGFDASRSNPIYGRSDTVQPDALMMQYYIKTDDEFNGSRYIGVNTNSGSYNEFGEGAVGTDATAIGRNASAKGDASVALGRDTVASGTGVVSVGHAATDINPATNSAYGSALNRRIVNVADGVDDHDVSTMGQLNAEAETRGTADNALSRRINQEATARQNNDVRLENLIGHMAENGNYIEADVPVTTNLYTLDNQLYEASQQLQREIAVREEAEQKIYNKIGFLEDDTDLLGSTDTVYENLQRLESAIKGNRATLDNAVVYTDGSYSRVNLAGANGTVINNVKAGLLAEDSLQAVNGSQLYQTNKNIAGFAADINRNKQSIRDLNQSVSTALESVSSSSILVDTINELKADASLNNLSMAGKQVIQTAAANAVQEYMAKNGPVMAPMAPMMASSSTLAVTNAGNGSLHVGEGSSVTGSQSIAIGVGNQVNANNAGAFGDPSVINADGSYVLGNDDTVNEGAANSFLVGNDSVSSAKGGLSLGSNNTLESGADDSVLLGNRASATAKNSVALGSGSVVSQDNAVSVGNDELKRKITNIMHGNVAENSSDAVTGHQLYQTNERITDLSGRIDTKANADASNVDVAVWRDKLAGNIAAGDTGFVRGSDVYGALMMSANDTVGYNEMNNTIHVGGNGRYDDVDMIDISKSDGTSRIMTGVATNPDDASSAANVAYVNAIGETIVKSVNASFEQSNRKMERIGASAAAMSALTPASFEGDEKWSLSASVGNYRSETAGAVGAFYRPAENVMMNVRGSFGNDENMVAAGVAVALNKGDVPGLTKRQLAQKVDSQQLQIQQQAAVINSQAERMNVMEQNHADEMSAVKKQMEEMAKTIQTLKEKVNS